MTDGQNQEFNSILIESIRETITQLLSPTVAESLFEHLEKAYSIKKDEIPFRLDALLLAIEKNFGQRSSQVIGKAIARRLYSQLGLEFSNNPQMSLVDYAQKAKLTRQ